MSNNWFLSIVLLGVFVGLLFGTAAGATLIKSPATLTADVVELGAAEQDDFIIMVAEAYVGDRDLQLARDRLARLHEQDLAARVESLARSYAPQRDLVSAYLAALAIGLGSRNPSLLALSAALTPTATSTPTRTLAPTDTPVPTETRQLSLVPTAVAPAAALSPTPVFTATRKPTRRPTPVPTPRPPDATPTAAAPAPAPATLWQPDKSLWPGNVYFVPANVAPGQKYWHLTKAIYCDAFDKSDPRGHDFGCDEMPGGPAGTSVYVMTGGKEIDAIRPDGANVGGDPKAVGEKKSPNDMCNCTYSFQATDYKISVAGAPSDAIGGFCLCSVNFGWGSRAHVRYFLYFEQVTR